MKTWTKSLLIAICLVILNISYATADPTDLPKPDSTVTEKKEIICNKQENELVVYQQVTTTTKVIHEAEQIAIYKLPENTDIWSKYDWRIESMIRQGARRDTMDNSYDWQSIKLLPLWEVPVRYGTKINKVLEFSPEEKSFSVKELRTPTQESLSTGWIFIPLCLLGFAFFWPMAKMNKFHLLGYYIMALTFLNLMATFDAPWLFTGIGIGGSIALAIYSTKKWNLNEEGCSFFIFMFHGAAFLVCFVGIEYMQLNEMSLDYWHFNILLISSITSGKIIAWSLLMTVRLIKHMLKTRNNKKTATQS
jgi:hypothetical protein